MQNKIIFLDIDGVLNDHAVSGIYAEDSTNINMINNLNLALEKTARNGETYNYNKVVYINSKLKIIISCNKHGDFLQSPGKHIAGQGCPNFF